MVSLSLEGQQQRYPVQLILLCAAFIGLHGPEIIVVTYNDKGKIEGRKITGDINVPCGKVSFSIDANPVASHLLPPEVLAVRQASVQAAGDEITHVHP